MPDPLGYFGPQRELSEPDDRLVSTALSCALGPMAAGVLTTLLSLLFSPNRLVILGAWVMLLGLLLFPIGVINLLVYVLRNWDYLRRGAHRERKWQSVTLAAVLLLGNFPVGAICIFVAQAAGAISFDK